MMNELGMIKAGFFFGIGFLIMNSIFNLIIHMMSVYITKRAIRNAIQRTKQPKDLHYGKREDKII